MKKPSLPDLAVFIAPLVSALLYFFALPVWPLPFLVFISLIPLMWSIRHARTPVIAASAGALWATLAALLQGYWIWPTLLQSYEVHPAPAILFVMLLALPYTLLGAAAALSWKIMATRKTWQAILLGCALWLLFEFAQQKLPLCIPFLVSGYSVLHAGFAAQIAELGGVFSLSALVFCTNALIYALSRRMIKANEPAAITRLLRPLYGSDPQGHGDTDYSSCTRGLTIALALALVLPQVTGFFCRQLALAAPAESRQAFIVQGNFSGQERWQDDDFFSRLTVYRTMSKDAPQGSVIIWPETELTSPGRIDRKLFAMLAGDQKESSALLTGGVRRNPSGKLPFNAVFMVDAAGKVAWYDKHILLPWVETSPSSLLGTYYSAPQQFASGTTPLTLPVQQIKAGMSVCFESLYPGHVRQSAAESQVLINLANDSWFLDTIEPNLHIQVCRMRSIENRRDMLRSSNSGYSAVIAADGSIVARSNLFRRETLSAPYTPRDRRTLYMLLGDWPVYAALALLFGWLALQLLRERHTKKDAS